MAFIPWHQWTKPRAWRKLAEKHTDKSGETYVTIGIEREDDEELELLRLSRYSPALDAEKPALRTSILEFDETPVEMSRRTRDVGVTRFITNKGKPIFVLEQGADIVEWMALREGVTVRQLLAIARRGEIGRAVRRKDRQALKASRQEMEATIGAYEEKLDQNEAERMHLKAEAMEYKSAYGRMVENQIRENQKGGHRAEESSGIACALGTAEKRGIKLVSGKPLPGNFEG